MTKIICAILTVVLWGGTLALSRNESRFNTEVHLLAQCSTWEIKNNCCFKFFKILESDDSGEPMETREKKALAEYKRCLDKDVGCSRELIELKAKSVREIRAYCK
jgi:hypothetical protein